MNTSKKHIVSLARQHDYDRESLKHSMAKLLEPFGGIRNFVKAGDRVILKPNLVMGFPPERAVTTHPEIIRAIGAMALDIGAKVSVGDSPGIGLAREAGEKAGMEAVLRDLGIPWVEFTPVETFDETRVFKKLVLARELLEADVVINLPKLKTHCQMLMTLATKNLFGSVVGTQKFQWHYRAGLDKDVFARMLYEIAKAIKPRLTIVDGIISMDGNGPTGGEPNPTGFLAAGEDVSVIDAVILDVLGIPREQLGTLKAAASAGDNAWKNATVVGENPLSLRPSRWKMPETTTLEMHASFLRRFPTIGRWLRRKFAAWPHTIEKKCVLCGDCVRICPAKAMTIDRTGIVINLDACIRCYCCHELCSHQAMGLKKSWVQRFL